MSTDGDADLEEDQFGTIYESIPEAEILVVGTQAVSIDKYLAAKSRDSTPLGGSGGFDWPHGDRAIGLTMSIGSGEQLERHIRQERTPEVLKAIHEAVVAHEIERARRTGALAVAAPAPPDNSA